MNKAKINLRPLPMLSKVNGENCQINKNKDSNLLSCQAEYSE